jgi:hypothetical protein
MLTRVRSDSALRSWGLKLKKVGFKRAPWRANSLW